MIEQLEIRNLLSANPKLPADVSVSLQGKDTLQIDGGKSDSMNIVVLENHGSVLVQNLVTQTEATYTGIKSIKINGSKESDTIAYQGNTCPADIKGGSGDDFITVLDTGNVSSKVDGGKGNDNIAVVFSHSADIKGGSGDDVISLNTAAAPNGSGGYDFDSSKIKVTVNGGDNSIALFAGDLDLHGGGKHVTMLPIT